jgi:outer membrane protein OmpA-like peptidoglycan-associated protein
MSADATFLLDAADASFGLDRGDATVPVSSSISDGDHQVIRLVSDLLFAFGSAELSAAVSQQLPEILADIPQGHAVQINGYTDAIGDDGANLILSQQRAQAVASAVAAARPDLIATVAGFGEADPVAANANADGSDNPINRAANRRVEIVWQS